MKIKIALIVFMSFLFYSCNSTTEKNKENSDYENPQTEIEDLIKRGEYIVSTSACHDCHTPKIMTDKGPVFDLERMLSGHPAEDSLPPYDQETAKSYILFNMGLTAATGPWGTSFSANLTPDDDGLGSWTEEQFFTAIRKGKYKGLEGSRDLLPPMPWFVYANWTDDDMKAVFAYLKSIKPVNNLVPAPIPPNTNAQ
jgi:hypothetical protein